MTHVPLDKSLSKKTLPDVSAFIDGFKIRLHVTLSYFFQLGVGWLLAV